MRFGQPMIANHVRPEIDDVLVMKCEIDALCHVFNECRTQCNREFRVASLSKNASMPCEHEKCCSTAHFRLFRNAGWRSEPVRSLGAYFSPSKRRDPPGLADRVRRACAACRFEKRYRRPSPDRKRTS